jgi:hypothetical protein
VPARVRPATDESTREMPRLKPAAPVAAPKPAAPAARVAAAQTPRPAAQKPAAAKPEPQNIAVSADMKGKIIADAIRLLKWGKPWHELAELIGRIAERPPVPEIRKILRANKTDIESKASG